MRVIGGEFGGRVLVAPPGTHVRPTTGKVRHAVFNSLAASGELVGASVADVFAGSGAMGIEALSRGAATCVFVERDRASLRALDNNLRALGLVDGTDVRRATVARADALAWVRTMSPVDVAFVDPPYAFDRWDALLGRLRAELVLAESDDEIPVPQGWALRRERRYGRTRVSALERVAFPPR